MPSRCIFFLSALRAWSTLLSRTRTCTRLSFCGSWGRTENGVPAREQPLGADESLPGRADLTEQRGKVHRCVGLSRGRFAAAAFARTPVIPEETARAAAGERQPENRQQNNKQDRRGARRARVDSAAR